MSTQTPQAPAVTADLGELVAAVRGRVLLPGTDDYSALATPWNVAVPSTPLAVIEVTDAADVAATLRYAARRGIEVTVQATGHGAVAQERQTLMVHTRLLDEVTIRPGGSARVGAGVKWERVLEAGAPHGLAGLAGSSPGVGVVGYLTGGGLGPVARTYGYASDYVTAFDVVTGDGEIRRASAAENPALFWGLRGGKGTLGIVTAVEFDLMPVQNIYGGCLYFDGADTAVVTHAWRNWAETLPEQASTSLAILRLPEMPGVPPQLAGRVAVAVRYAWVGDPEEGRRAIAPLQDVVPVILGGVGEMPYAAIGSIHADPVDPMPAQEGFTLLRELPVEAVDTLLELAGPDAACPQVIVELRLLGGAIRRAAQPSAVSHRDAAYGLVAIGLGVPPIAEPTAQHTARMMAAMQPWSTGLGLPNFEATADPKQVVRKYDGPTLARLGSLARTYDPRAILTAAHGVRSATAQTVGR